MSIDIINPANGKTVRSFNEIDIQEANHMIEKSYHFAQQWKFTSFKERAALLEKWAQAFEVNKDKLAHLMAEEMGKPIPQGESEVDKCAWVCRYYAEHGEKFLSNLNPQTNATESIVTFQPLGPILAIMPWNFPYWQVMRFAAPAVMAGNVCLLKHAPNVTGCALQLEDMLKDAGAPEGLFQVLLTNVEDTGKVIDHPKVAAVTLTGSARAGRSVASRAGKALKKAVLELGGSDPYLILDDADIKLAAETCVNSRLLNTGQTCIAAKRFIVTQKNSQAFTDHMIELMKAKTYGDPLQGNFDLGPMARIDLRDELHNQVEKSVKKGAKCVLGGTVPSQEGCYYPSTILTNVTPGMPAYEEELFGPVASIIEVANEEEAIKVANDTIYGLGAGIFSKNTERAKEIAEKHINAGAVAINSFVKSDPRLPFGGVKQSGFGRELSHFGMLEFVNIKSIMVD